MAVSTAASRTERKVREASATSICRQRSAVDAKFMHEAGEEDEWSGSFSHKLSCRAG